MKTITTLLIIFIAIQHFGFLYLEMFLWTKKTGRKIFANTEDFAEKSKTLAANQGLYNGFLAAGLIWGLCHPSAEFGQQIVLFFLLCVIIAGVYGGITAKKTILYIQALPACVAAALVFLS